MGQPIYLQKGSQTLTVYGRSQAAVHVAEGWQLVDSSITLPAAPEPAKLEPDHDAIDATDTAVALAKKHNIDLATITGTGVNGRIVWSDVKNAMGE